LQEGRPERFGFVEALRILKGIGQVEECVRKRRFGLDRSLPGADGFVPLDEFRKRES
jgi:hypothetical protein